MRCAGAGRERRNGEEGRWMGWAWPGEEVEANHSGTTDHALRRGTAQPPAPSLCINYTMRLAAQPSPAEQGSRRPG